MIFSLNTLSKYGDVSTKEFINLSNYVTGLYLSPPLTNAEGETLLNLKRRGYFIFSLNKILDRSYDIRSDAETMEIHADNCTRILKNSIESGFLEELLEAQLTTLFIDNVSRYANTHTLSPTNLEALKQIVLSVTQGAKKGKKSLA